MSVGAPVPWDPKKCASCGQWLSPAWKDKCLHCGASMAIANPASIPVPPAPFTKSVFRSVSTDDATKQAEADMRRAGANGYELDSQSWADDQGIHVLTVVYRYTGRAAVAPAAGWATPASASEISPGVVAGVAVLASAAFSGLLALQQYNLAQQLKALIDTSTLWNDALINAISAVIGAAIGAKILREPTRSTFMVGIVFAILSVVGGLAQPNALANGYFLVGTVAAGVGGVASYVARQRLTEH